MLLPCHSLPAIGPAGPGSCHAVVAMVVSPFLARCSSPLGEEEGEASRGCVRAFVCVSGPCLSLSCSPGLPLGLWFCLPPHAVLCMMCFSPPPDISGLKALVLS